MKLPKRTVNLPYKLHQAVKMEAVKKNTTIEALVAKTMWNALGGINHETNPDNH